MYLYIRTCSHYVTYLVNYQYLIFNTKRGTVSIQCWAGKFSQNLNFDFINPYINIQSLYIISSPMYDYFKEFTILYHYNLYLNRCIIKLFEHIRVVKM